MTTMTFGQIVKHERERRKLSQSELARLAGIRPNKVSDIERDVPTGNNTLHMICRLARAFRLTPAQLLRDFDAKSFLKKMDK